MLMFLQCENVMCTCYQKLRLCVLGNESVAIIFFTETAPSATEKGTGSKFNQRYPQCEECGYVAGVH